MAPFDPDAPSLHGDAAFERWLLDSARADAPPDGATEAAWLQLSNTANAALPIEAPPVGRAGAAATGGATTLKWLAIGALGGALVTATWMGRPPSDAATAPAPAPAPVTAPQLAPPAPQTAAPSHADPEPPVAPQLAPPAPQTAAPSHADPEPPAASATRIAEQAPAKRPVPTRSPRTPRARALDEPPPRARPAPRPAVPAEPPIAAASQEPPPATLPSSTLEREVALLDAVRRALTSSNFDGALELVDEYRHQFEGGELARDADVFEIEALAGRGDRAQATSAAQTFLRRYPNDPHATRLRAFVEPPPH